MANLNKGIHSNISKNPLFEFLGPYFYSCMTSSVREGVKYFFTDLVLKAYVLKSTL